ncbi:MAG: UPF0175 family protein [Dehalococcoidia bacterium]|nr:UPF0175 family protein [Dehalococcoidia bacterium]
MARALKEWKMEYYAQAYGQNKMTLAKAAEEAGVSLWEMMEYARQKKIPAQYNLDDLEHDHKTVSRRRLKAGRGKDK